MAPSDKSGSEGESDYGHGRYSTSRKDISRCSMKYFGQWKTRIMTFMDQTDSKMFSIVKNGDFVPFRGGETVDETKPTDGYASVPPTVTLRSKTKREEEYNKFD